VFYIIVIRSSLEGRFFCLFLAYAKAIKLVPTQRLPAVWEPL